MLYPLRTTAAVFCSIAIVAAQEAEAPRPAAGAPAAAPALFEPRDCGASSLSVISGIPVLRLSGTPEQAGAAAGKLLEREIALLFESYLEPASALAGGLDAVVRMALEMDPHVPERYRQEMQALAAAAGVEYGKILAANAFPDLYRRGGCSTFAASGPATAGGAPLLARNLDFFGMGVLHKTGMVAVVRPDGFKHFASVTWPGLSGVLSGMNADGLCCAVMEVRGAGDNLDGMPSAFLFRRVLEEAADVEEALVILQKNHKVTGNNLTLLDRTGAAATAELGPGFCNVRRAEKGMVFSTNHHRSGKPKPPACPRYAAFEAWAQNAHGSIDVARLKQILLEVDQDLITVQTMIFEPAVLRLHLAMGTLPATAGEFAALELAETLE